MTIHDRQIHLDANKLEFNVFSSNDIEKLSVCKITSSVSFDSIGNSVTGGLYDVAMGPSSKNDICSTCSNDINGCTGHFGHVQLTMPVYNPFFIKTVKDILSLTCLKCFRLQISDHIKSIVKLQLELVDAGYIIEAQALEVLKSEEIANSSSSTEQEENCDEFVHPKVSEFCTLLKNHPQNQFNVTKNTRAIRNAIVNSTIKGIMARTCRFCKNPIRRVKFTYKRLVYSISKKEMEEMQRNNELDAEEVIKSTNKTIFADECRHYFKQLFKIDGKFLRLLLPVLNTMQDGYNVFFMDIVPVVPPNVRPANRMRDGLVEHPQTKTYYNVISTNNQLRYIVAHDKIEKGLEVSEKFLQETANIYKLARGETTEEKIYYKWQELQTFVDQTLDISIGNSQKTEGFGLKQIIEKKEGLIRMHMMGKRVNFAARTVITPDPNINIDQIGVPEAFALKLTYPVPVTDWNVSELRKMVTNGPNIHPGACFIEEESGFKRKIPDDIQKREALANTLLTPNENRGVKIVHRHLINGDVLLLNRQPSLHRPSIMAHRARILKGEKTFRMHYSNCKSYNADFDGDEMNAHFPQTELGRSEAYNLVNVASNYLVPKDGTPLGGLIQDHMISGAKLALRGRFFNKEDYQQLVFQGLSHCKGELKLLPPAILKPKQLWSGKQILSTLIINLTPKGVRSINLNGQAKISSNSWQSQKSRKWLAGGTPFKQNEMSESEVVIRNGELLSGILDKNHYGATPFSLVHCIYELYGGEVSTQLLTSLAKIFTIFLQWEGFTLGVHDILVLSHADKIRQEIVEKSRKAGRDATAQALELIDPTDAELAQKLEEAYVLNPKFRVILDRKYKSVMDSFTNDINKTCLPAGLLCKFPSNNLQLMVMSGAKGSTVNTMQISCLLGQIELEGKRPPLMISGKSLPSFPAWEMSPKSGGFIDGRFMTGIQPQDFFFHCMAGREGLIDTAVKTSRSGYLQRCLVKHLEGLTVNYDMTVRDSDNSVVQFMYGEDGMDISKSQFLKQNQLAFLQSNHSAIVNEETLKQLQNTAEMDEELRKHNKKIRVWKKRNGDALFKQRLSGFVHFSSEMQYQVQVKNPNKLQKSSGRTKLTKKLIKSWQEISPEAKAEYQKLNRKCPEPTVSTYMPHSYMGSVSEYIEKLLDSYGSKSSIAEIKDLMYIKSIGALADAGEPVGLLAAQSIGEPSTQMTLNTFHFAGRGDMNVTLGIPRLREILMMASSNIKTPSMEIPFQNQKSRKLPKTAEKFRVRLNRVTVADVLESIDVTSCLVLRPKRSRQFELTFNFLPQDAYKHEFSVKPKKIIQHMHQRFIGAMFKSIKKAAMEKLSYIEKDEVKKTKGSTENENAEIDEKAPETQKNSGDSSDEEPLGDDMDATDARKRDRQMDEQDYEEPEQIEADVESDSEDSENEEFDSRKVKREKIVDENADEEQLENIEMKEILATELADQHTILQTIVKKNAMALDYQHDTENFMWCKLRFELPLKYKNIDLTNPLREAARSSVIWEITKLKRAITFKQADQLLLKTDGINIHAMFEFDKILDLNRLYTNDIHAVAQTYGIEAAGRVIVKEVQNVFKVYGITVDPRHLLLIADYMTSDGTFQPMSRRGMESSASPLQQLSFESALQFLKVATVQGRSDDIDSPSSCLMMGMPCKSGTGAFSLVNNLAGMQIPNKVF